MKKKTIILSLLAFILPVAAIGTAFASFSYSSKVDKEEKQSSAHLDDIKPNFKIKEDDYTIYFFPSMQVAKAIKSNASLFIDSEGKVASDTKINEIIDSLNPNTSTSNDGTDWGRWNSSSYQYYPRKVVTKGGPSMSLDEYRTIGEPFTTGLDNGSSGSTLEFAGWSADIDAVISSYSSQCDYKFVSAFNDFYDVDYSSSKNSYNKDGTKANDHIVFLYPIFTTGKNYSSPEKTSIKLENKTTNRNYYFADYVRLSSDETYNQNKTIYYFKNLIIGENETWSLKYAGLNSDNSWNAYQNYTHNNIETPFYSPDDTGIIKESGIYNVYVYQYIGTRGNSFSITSVSTYFQQMLTSNNAPLVYADSFDPSYRKTLSYNIGDFTYWTFIKVEKVFEFKLLGTESRGFSLDSGSQLHLSNYDSLTTANEGTNLKGPWKVYYLDNVYLNANRDYRYNQFSNDGNTYKVKKKVFSFLADNNEMNVPFSAMNETELSYINKKENIDDELVYETFGSDSEVFNKLDKSSPLDKDGNKYIDLGQATDSTTFPFEYDKDTYLDYFFESKLKYSAYCRLLLLVYFNSSTGKPSNIKVAIAPYQKDSYTIYVYPSPKDLTYSATVTNKQDYIDYQNNGLNSRKDENTGLIDPEQDEFLENIVLTKIKIYKKNDYFLDGYEVEDSNGSKSLQNIYLKGVGNMSVSNFFTNYLPNKNKEIIDHITGKAIEMNLQFKRFVACYLTDIK